jgi:hypothetical protein
VKTGEAAFNTGAAIYRRLTFRPTSEAPVDLTHIGALSTRVVNDEPEWGLVQITFPNVSTNGQAVAAEVHINAAGDATGTIESGGTVLAVISGTGFESVVTWQGDCAVPAAP